MNRAILWKRCNSSFIKPQKTNTADLSAKLTKSTMLHTVQIKPVKTYLKDITYP